MSEGTPGRGPDADTRADEGQAANGRPAPQTVRYGPRNGSPRGANGSNGTNGANGRGSNGRTDSGPSSPQQYRGPQAPRGPQNGQPGPVGNGPASYTHPRPNGAPTRPVGTPEDREIADARTAAAARNGSSAKVRGGSALTPPVTARGTDATSLAPVVDGASAEPKAAPADETAVIPVTPDDQTSAAVSTDQPGKDQPGEDQPAEDREPGLFGRLRDRLVAKTELAEGATTAPIVLGDSPATETESRQEPETAQAGDPEERPLTWRDRLGLPPKAPKPQPVDVPASGPGVPTGAAAAALAAGAAAGTDSPETKAIPVGPTTAPQPTEPLGRVTPASPVAAAGTDTVIIPAVDAGVVGPAAPAAAGTTQALVAAKPKVGIARRTRKARLRLSRVDPWSVMKTALLFSIAAGIILVVATYGVWSVLNASGLFDALNDMVKSVVSTPGDTTPFRIEEYVNTQKVIGVAALIAVVDVLIFTALATLGSFLYNLAATVLGGLEVTLAED